jgi:predicted nucleic-acid-binding protein
MIGLDTNVIVRYITQDDPKQAKLANQLIEQSVAEGVILKISQVTLCETVWVLERCYNSNKKEIVDVVKQLLYVQHIQIENKSIAWQALRDYEQHVGIDFTDCLIGRQNAANDCTFTYTFDKNAAKKLQATFKLIS